MPQPIAYNTGSQTSGSLKLNGIEYAISSSIVSGSNGQRWFTSVNPGNGIVLVTNSFTQSYSTYQNSTPLFYTASALTAAAITGAINGLPDRFGLPRFTDTASAFAWVANNRKYFMMNYEYPQIVTDGLILLNDAKFLASYPTTQSTWYDVSGNNKNGSLINGPLFDSNRGAIVFDGINETVSYGTGNTFFPLPSFSIELTFQSKGTVPTTGTQPGLFGFTFGIRAIFNSANNIQFAITSGSVLQNLNYSHTSNFRDDGKWYNIIFQATPTNSYIYLNGELKASRSVVWLGSTIWPTNGWNLARDNNDGFYFFTGSISNFKMYNKALTQAEILQNYYGGPIVTNGLVFAVDASNLVSYENGSTTTYSLTGSLSGSLINGVGYNSVNGGSWIFDGIDDFISGSDTPFRFTNTFTLDAWVYFNGSNIDGIIISKRNGSPFNQYSLSIYSGNPYVGGVGKVATFFGRADGGGPDIILNYTLPSAGFYNIVASINATSQTLYVNGVARATTSVNISSNTFNISGRDLLIGATRNNAGTGIIGPFLGNIYNVKIYNRALSAEEVSQNFNAQRSRFGI